MKMLMKMLVLSIVVGLWPVAAQAYDFQVRPTGDQNGSLAAPSSVIKSNANMYYGVLTGTSNLWAGVGIHTIPGSITASSQIASAQVRIPQTDHSWSGPFGNMSDTETWYAKHIDAANDSSIGIGDLTGELSTLGVWRSPGPQSVNGLRYATIDVTAALKADIDASSNTFAWRLEPDVLDVTGSASGYVPNVGSTDGAFGTLDGDAATDNHGSRLLITLVPEPATAGLMLLGGLGLLRRRR